MTAPAAPVPHCRSDQHQYRARLLGGVSLTASTYGRERDQRLPGPARQAITTPKSLVCRATLCFQQDDERRPAQRPGVLPDHPSSVAHRSSGLGRAAGPDASALSHHASASAVSVKMSNASPTIGSGRHVGGRSCGRTHVGLVGGWAGLAATAVILAEGLALMIRSDG